MISTDIDYPSSLPWPVKEGYAFEDVDTFSRTTMVSGRAAQRMLFDFVPSIVSVTWVFTSDGEASAFRSWFRERIDNGAAWFNMPLKTPIGEKHYICRFATMPKGPDMLGPCSWQVSARLEMFERPMLPLGWGERPDWLTAFSLLDIAMNDIWPEES